jgi:hypothetical protein
MVAGDRRTPVTVRAGGRAIVSTIQPGTCDLAPHGRCCRARGSDSTTLSSLLPAALLQMRHAR